MPLEGVDAARPKANLLIVDDDDVVRDSLAKWFEEDGYRVETAQDGREALLKLPCQPWDLALIDLRMPGMDGLELNRELHQRDPELIVVIMTGYASVETAVRALKDGAYDYITKPFDPHELDHTIAKALEHRRTKDENVRLRQTLEETQSVELVGRSQPLQRALEIIHSVAGTDSPVLIHGESGTGKETVARAIHNLSDRRFMPLATIHCGVLSESTLGSELFGHEMGAWAGAQYRRRGKFEVAEGGTVFLDEIAELSLPVQVELQRILERNEVTRTGGSQPIKLDCRIIAATSRNLAGLVGCGAFRPGLHYILNVAEIVLPPLRERKEDIPLLAQHFLRKYARAMNKRFTGFSAAAQELLLGHPWRGNVRELENAIERAMVVGREPQIEAVDLPLHLPAPPRWEGSLALDDVERLHIQRVLKLLEWNQTRAAKALGIDRVTLYNKIKKYGFAKANAGTT